MTNLPLLDTRHSVETPEGIDFSASVAGPVPRILAYCIDFAWRGLVYLLLGLTSAFSGEVGTGLFLICAFLLEWFYPVFFELVKQGQTPGKKAMGLCVVNDDLTPVRWGGSLIRNLLRTADFFPAFYLFGLFSITLSSRFQRLGDMAAGTLVIYQEKEQPSPTPSQVNPAPPLHPLTPTERQAITNFLSRSEVISQSRQVELSDILEPISGARGETGLQRIKAIGAWLQGRK